MLRVHPAAEHDVIRAAYRALARLHHPDVTTSDSARARMVEINRAWAILGDPTTRAELDRARRGAPADGRMGTADVGTGREGMVTPAWMARHAADRRPPAGWGAGAAGPPPGRPSGSVIDFGIYLGWSLGEVERRDPGYLDWLAERREGEPYRSEILTLQARRRAAQQAQRRPRFGFG